MSVKGGKGGSGISLPKSQSTGTLARPKVQTKVTAVAKTSGLSVVKKTAVVEGLSDSAMQELLELSETARRERLERLLADSSESAKLSLAQILDRTGLLSSDGSFIMTSVLELLVDSSSESRERGLSLSVTLLRQTGKTLEPFLCPLLPMLLSLHADRSAAVRDLSAAVVKALLEIVSPHTFRELLYPAMKAAWADEDWRIKVGGLQALGVIAPRCSSQLSPLLPEIIPAVSECILDAKKQVQTAAAEAMVAACQAISNDDVRPLVPQLVSVIARPDESERTLNLFLETTFVATVDAAVLALIAPLLGKSLKQRSSSMKRKASRVIDIMCRLVTTPSDVAPFVPLLLPALERVIDELVDEEVCEVAKAAREVLLKAMSEGFVNDRQPKRDENSSAFLDPAAVSASMLAVLTSLLPYDPSDALTPAVLGHIALITAHQLVFCTQRSPLLVEGFTGEPWRAQVAMVSQADWTTAVAHYLRGLLGESSGDEPAEHRLAAEFRLACLGDVPDDQFDASGDDANLCNIEFSLAFGGKILLHNTFLRLGKGRRYGVLGKNGAGKTTLLTNIGNGNIEGLPKHLKMIYVQHDNVTDDNGVPVIDELMASKDVAESQVTREEAMSTLKGIGFTDAMLEAPRSMLSGGWKMKLLIMKAMISKADVLLLDEVSSILRLLPELVDLA